MGRRGGVIRRSLADLPSVAESVAAALTVAQVAALRDLEEHGQYYHHDDHAASTYRALHDRGLIEWSSSAAGGWYVTPAGTDAILARDR